MSSPPEEIPVTVDGGTLPVVDVLTGRGFITGKSGAGKSVTTSVITEELLKHNLGFLIVDTDGEYYGLKEHFQILHVGADDSCDAHVGVEHAPTIAEIALEGMPVIMDVSGYLDEDEVEELLERLVRELFVREKDLRKPFLLIVEEVHEYLPETSGLTEFGERLLQIAKRGRKRGLGMCGVSQRPAAVDKDFITQCNWIIWHRLTWNNDTDVVARIIDSDAAQTVEDLENGEALLMTDWDEDIKRVKFRMRETADVGKTPDFSEHSIPELRPVDPSYVQRLRRVSGDRADRKADGSVNQDKVDTYVAEDASSIDRVEADDVDEEDYTHLAETNAENGDEDDGAEAAVDEADEESVDADEAEDDGSDDEIASSGSGGATATTSVEAVPATTDDARTEARKPASTRNASNTAPPPARRQQYQPSRPRKSSTIQRENLLVEIGDLTVFIFFVLRTKLGAAISRLLGGLAVLEQRLLDATTRERHGITSVSPWVYLLVFGLGIAIGMAIFMLT